MRKPVIIHLLGKHVPAVLAARQSYKLHAGVESLNVRYLGLSLLLLLVIWQTLAWLGQWPSYLLPTPVEVVHSILRHYHELLLACVPTLTETLLGLVLGVMLGTLFALGLALVPPLRRLFLPLLVVSQALPIFVLAPLLVLWFGFGILSKILVITLMLFFPVASALDDGLRQTPKEQLEYAQSVHCGRLRLLFGVKLPNAMPAFATGLKLAACYAPMGAIIAEWVGASNGLGALLLRANTELNMPLVFATMMIIIVFTLTLYLIMHYLCTYLQS